MGGPLGSSIGMAAGGMLGTVMGGGQVTGSDVAKTALGLAGGAIAGTAGRMVGSALGGLFGQGQEKERGGGGEIEGGGGGQGGAVSVSGGGMEGEPGEMTRLLREMSMNIKALVNDGIFIKGGHWRPGGSVI